MNFSGSRHAFLQITKTCFVMYTVITDVLYFESKDTFRMSCKIRYTWDIFGLFFTYHFLTAETKTVNFPSNVCSHETHTLS